MPRTLLLSETFPPDAGGMAQSADRIVRGLRARGAVVDVVHLGARVTRLACERQAGGHLWRCPLEDEPEHALNLLWNALEADAAVPAQVVAFGGHLPLLAAPVFAAWWQVPLTVLLRGNDFDVGILSPRRGWIVREALARAARIAVVSREMQRRVATLYPEHDVRWIPNGIDARDWCLHEFDRERARAWRARNVVPGRRVLGVFGHIKQKKGGVLLLDALRTSGVADRFHLLLAGEIDGATQLALSAVGEVAGVTRLPFLDRYELLPWYAACDLIALPSHYDGLPNVALEAAALGLPLLASRAGGLADLLHEDAGAALAFAPGDVARCADALAQAATLDADELRRCGERLRERVLRDFGHEAEIARYADLFDATPSEATRATTATDLHEAPLGARSH